MTAPFENIVQHLFHQPSLQSVTVEELEQMSEQHPSFAAARFLLLKKMQDTEHPGFAEQLYKTTLYFNNPLWLQFLLKPRVEKATTAHLKEHAPIKEETLPKEEDKLPEETQAVLPAVDETITEPEETSVQPIEEITDTHEPVTIETNEPIATGEPVKEEVVKEERPLLKTIIETPAAKDDLLFEPFHTIDYFASQGIKLSAIEANPQDKFGKQLKSFTEWLRSMKKLPQASIEKALAENEESQVVTAAASSLSGKEVITEAMAEVLEKQGLYEKAEEVYRKLSLLNPPKSAYFAAKIEALKK